MFPVVDDPPRGYRPTYPDERAARQLAEDLRRGVKGEVRFDEVTRYLYSTDASIYQILPVGVVCPLDEADVAETIRICARRGIPVLPRGGGTALAGQTVGAAVVIDFSPSMNRVLEVNPEERWVRVQPGVVLDELNAALRPHGLFFAPDVATSNRATIGGMVGNNSCGARSIRYGKTIDHVLELECLLSDGSRAVFRELGAEGFLAAGAGPGLEARIYREVARIVEEHREAVDAAFPRIMRRVGGYNLDEFVRRDRWSLAALVVGSEGTLAAVTAAKLALTPLPASSALLVSHFHTLDEALASVPRVLEASPSAVELLDRMLLGLTRDQHELARARTFLQGDPEGLLVVEFQGDSVEEVRERMESLAAALEREGAGFHHARIADPDRQKDVWTVRKAGVGVLMGMKGDRKPVGFVEDTAVPVERLADYVREFRAVMGEYGLEACYYAHASVGCLHIRPVLNLKDPADRARIREIAIRVTDLVLRYGGAISGEHGDGLARSEFQERVFGPEVTGAFREVKRAFDPHGIMNPGKIVDAPPMNRHLRYTDDYVTPEVPTLLDFSPEGGLARAVEMCSGAGACRKKLEGVMCPSYRATLDEEHSTRGRANMLRMLLSGQAGVPAGTLADPRALAVLDLCLACKACKSECPSSVDMARLKYELLAQWHRRERPSLRTRVLGRVGTAADTLASLAPVVNFLQESALVRSAMERWLEIDRRRSLPRFAGRTFRQWFRSHLPDPRAGSRGQVLLVADTFTNTQEPEVGEAAVRVLEAMGYGVTVPELKCCGRPQLSHGLAAEAIALARHNVERLEGPARRGLPLLVPEPSCAAMFRDDYRAMGLGPPAEAVAEAVRPVEQFVGERLAAGAEPPFRRWEREVLVHAHCHQRAVFGAGGLRQALEAVEGFRVRELPQGCCGMAGSFGYEREHYDLSLRIAELGLAPAVRAAAEEALVAAPGTSCRHQIRDTAGRTALHPIQLLAGALEEEGV